MDELLYSSGSGSSYESSQSPTSMGSNGYSLDDITYVDVSMQPNNVNNEDEVMIRPYLKIMEQPQDKFRYRYVSELHGTHGCLMGVNSMKMKKTYPSVKLMNYDGEATIRCTIYTVDDNHRVPHPHLLVGKTGRNEYTEPHDRIVSKETGYEITYRGIGIIQTARKNLTEVLIEKLTARKKEEIGDKRAARKKEEIRDTNIKLTRQQEFAIRETAEQEVKRVNLNSVCLCFEAYIIDEDTGALKLICAPVFSTPIHNLKSAQTNDLRICRMDRIFGSCKGGDEVFILVEKVNRTNIEVRFFELNEDDNEVWSAKAIFSELDVHHQYAIVFKTPPYKKDLRLSEKKEVFFELRRPSDGLRSDPHKFTYRPFEKDMYCKKRRRDDEATTSHSETSVQSSRVYSPSFIDKSSYQIASNPSAFVADPIPPSHILDDEEDGSVMDNLAFNCVVNIDNDDFHDFMQILEKDGIIPGNSLEMPEIENSNIVVDGAAEQQLSRNLVKDSKKLKSKSKSTMLSKAKDETESSVNEDATSFDTIQVCDKSEVNKICSDLTVAVTNEEKKLLASKVIPRVQKATETLCYTDVAKILLHLVNPKAQNDNNVLHCAVKFGQLMEVKQLLKYLKKYLQVDELQEVITSRNKHDQTLLDKCVLQNYPKMLTELLNCKASTNFDILITPMHLAILLNKMKCLSIFISHLKVNNISLDEPDNDGLTLLYTAVKLENVLACELLLTAGANPNKGNFNSMCSCLHLAVEKQNIDIASLILSDSRTDINIADLSGNTPLHFACVVNNIGSLSLIKLLIDAGADPWHQNKDCSRSSADKIMKDFQNFNLEATDDTKLIIQEETSEDSESGTALEKKGKNAFDLAANKPEILSFLQEAAKKRIKVEIEEEDFYEDAVSEQIDTETAMRADDTGTLDGATLHAVSEILCRKDAWKELAQSLGLEEEIPSLQILENPAKHLLIGCKDQITTQELRDLLEALNQLEAMHIVNNMLRNMEK